MVFERINRRETKRESRSSTIYHRIVDFVQRCKLTKLTIQLFCCQRYVRTVERRDASVGIVMT